MTEFTCVWERKVKQQSQYIGKAHVALQVVSHVSEVSIAALYLPSLLKNNGDVSIPFIFRIWLAPDPLTTLKNKSFVDENEGDLELGKKTVCAVVWYTQRYAKPWKLLCLMVHHRGTWRNSSPSNRLCRSFSKAFFDVAQCGSLPTVVPRLPG